MEVQGITWNAVVLERDELAAKKKLPDAIPAYGFNDGIVFGFRVNDIEAASAELAEAR